MSKKLFLLVAALFGVCSCSEDSENVYDEVLSNTEWIQIYFESKYIISVENDGTLESIKEWALSFLESQQMPSESESDTIWNITTKNKYVLTFFNENCELKDFHYKKGNYQIKTYEVLVTYYPDQVYNTDLEFDWSLEITLRKDSLIVDRTHPDGDEVCLKFALDGENRMYKRGGVISSGYYPYEAETYETYNMTFVRNGNKVQLTGDMNITGTLNKSMDEIDFKDIGTVYKQ